MRVSLRACYGKGLQRFCQYVYRFYNKFYGKNLKLPIVMGKMRFLKFKDYRYLSIIWASSAFERAPLTDSNFSPSLNTIKVGTKRTPKRTAVSGLT